MKKIRDYVEKITSGKIVPDNYQLSQFEKYYEMLIEKNKVMNLTAITDKEEVILKHFIDSVALVGLYDFCNKPDIKVIDVGTGAGFPGIPLKIICPGINIVLYDSLGKRVKFLDEVIDGLGIDRDTCKAVHGRAEEGGRDRSYRECFDIVVSRAVANMSVLAEYCLPFVRQGGYFIPYKTGKIDEELNQAENAIKILGGRINRVERIVLPGSDISRSFVFISKEGKTPKTFPRRPGTANKQPLR